MRKTVKIKSDNPAHVSGYYTQWADMVTDTDEVYKEPTGTQNREPKTKKNTKR